ncbi:hypothetical protein FIBSPDRAFT_38398 [Athelia psychrophila]|uniref:Uncharacterized protein n=1 Tax=Athelia psychrophila TaxID=1759441 RepID=A0A166FJI1_9AGAM|nr:hypothetical protein FIBSPDRAFT_38398 [Fibularhizoctonia sp. CBS 109695]
MNNHCNCVWYRTSYHSLYWITSDRSHSLSSLQTHSDPPSSLGTASVQRATFSGVGAHGLSRRRSGKPPYWFLRLVALLATALASAFQIGFHRGRRATAVVGIVSS